MDLGRKNRENDSKLKWKNFFPTIKQNTINQIIHVSMNSRVKSSIILFLLIFAIASAKAFNSDSVLVICKSQINTLISKSASYAQYPRSLNTSSAITYVGASDWTSGFIPGLLWNLGDYFKDATLKTKAANFTTNLASQQYNTSTHDVGFMMYCSYGNGYKLNTDQTYKNVLINSANSLKSRYNSVVGCTRSWDFGTWSFPVIIDNMMNLELLFWATKVTGDSSYYKIADSHASRVLNEFIRPDFTSYHVVDFNPITGKVIKKQTFQGASDESIWARGQGWELYGFTMCYRETGNLKYLTLARNIAQWIKNHLPIDYVPYWDYMAPNIPNEPRDASAAAIYASALLELSMLDKENAKEHFNLATKILESLSSPNYLSNNGLNSGFVLKHCTGHKPANKEIDVPINYGDYYFIEALTRYQKAKVMTSISQPKATNFKIYPNPIKNSFVVRFNQQKEAKLIRIIDMNGCLVAASEPTTTIACDFLHKGNYIVQIEYSTGKLESQLVIKD